MASLGTLTLDVVARTSGFVAGLSKAERASKKWKAQVRRDIADVSRRLGRGLAVGGAAAAAGLAVVVQRSRQAIDEQAKLAQQLNTTSTSLANLSRAGELTGVTFKQITVAGRQLDVALAKAAQGEATYADAVDALGLSIEELIDLPLDQKLQAVNRALIENVAKTERAAVAADLFGTRNGAAIRQLQPDAIAQAAKEVEIFGLNLSDIDAAKVELANDALSTIALGAKGAGQQLTVALAPALQAVGDAFLNSAEAAGGLGDAAERAVDKGVAAVAFLADAADGVGRVFDTVANSIVFALAGIASGAASTAADIVGVFSLIPGTIGDEFAATAAEIDAFAATQTSVANQAAAAIRDNLERPLAGNAIKQGYEDAKVAAEAAAAAAVEAREARNVEADIIEQIELAEVKVLAAKKETSAELQRIISQNEAYYGLVSELRTEEEQINDKLRERLSIIDQFGGSDTAETRQRVIADVAIAAPEVTGLDAAVGGPLSELQRLGDEQAALDEWYMNELDRYAKYREDKLISQMEYNSLEMAAKQEHEDGLAQIERARQVASLVAAEAGFSQLADLTRQFAGEQSDAYKVLFAIEKGAAIARSIIAIQTAIAQAATAAPFPANLAAMASVASATAGLISTITSTTIQGQAHDGLMSVPRTGTYILEQGERVVSAETTAKMDKQLDEMASGGGVRIVNSFDSQEVVGGYLGSGDGERTVMNIVRRNQATIRSLSQ